MIKISLNNVCFKRFIFLIILCFIMFLQFGCEKKANVKFSVDHIYYISSDLKFVNIDENEEIQIEEMATLYNYKVESKKMGFTTRFQYEIDHVLFDRNIPLIEGAPQEAYIYKNGELIYSDVEKKKFKQIEYSKKNKIFGSTVFFSLKGDYPFNIIEVGEYEIKIKVQYKVNGELRESDNTFSFRIV